MNGLESSVRAASSRELPRAELSAAIVTRLEQLGAPAESIAAAKKIAQPKSVVVVAGQQPVLFGGPGLVWAKQQQAQRTAAEIEERFGVPCVEVFWNASEDHDHAEVDHVRMDVGDEIETLRVPLPGDRRMLSRVPVPDEARTLLDGLRAKLPTSAGREDPFAALAPSPSDTMGSWFSRILVRKGVVVVEPETMRGFAKSVVGFEIDRPGELAASIRGAETAAVARGEPAALDLARDELFFLLDDAGRRLRVTRDGDAWRVEDGRVFSAAQMRAMPADSFSWNVAARVLAQDIALPVAAQVCGPSEIRYCARLGAAHALLGVAAPALVRRMTWVFVTSRAERLCRQLGVEPWVVARDGAAAFGSSPARTESAEATALRAAVAALPTGGSAAVQRRRGALAHDLDAYVQAVRRDEEEKDAAASSRRARLLALLRPDGEWQDRRFSPMPWLARLDNARCVEQRIEPETGAAFWTFFVAPGNPESSA